MDVRSRVAQIAVAFLLAAAGLIVRLGVLQIGQHDFWEQEAVKARTRAVPIAFRRGAILDDHGRPIATTRTTWDLDLVFAELRRGTASGQLLLSHYLLTGERLRFAEVLDDPAARLNEFAALTIGEMRRLEPGARRADLLSYAAWLHGETRTAPLIDRLRRERDDALCCPFLAEERATILDRVRAEAATIAQLERALVLKPGELVAAIDKAIAAIDARALRLLAKRDRGDKHFDCERELHKELDYRPATLRRNVDLDAVFELAADPRRFPGLVVSEHSRRVDPPENDVCPQLIGRVGQPDAGDLKQPAEWADEQYELQLEAFPTVEQLARIQELDELLRIDAIQPDDELGKEGLEASFESLLRGRRGFKKSEADRAGEVQRIVELVDPEPGRDLQLTLDVELQHAAEAALARGVPPDKGAPRKPFRGAFVLLELPERKIRVLASNPAPSRQTISEDFTRLAKDEETRPLHPRAWRPWLPPPPGSSVKPILAALALTSGLIGPGTQYECNKTSLFAPGEKRPIKCEGLHGSIGVHDALVHSCNHYFAHLAYAAGSERMVAWLQSVGFGRATEFTGARLASGLEVESLASEPTGHAQHEAGGRNLMLLGLGQGRVDVTPLQVAAAMGALALRSWQPPTLIERVGDETPLRDEPVALPIDEPAWKLVVDAMRDVTLVGTADPAHGADLTEFDLATKTGTPQQGGPNDLDHSWFVGFFPSRAPRYAFAIFLERTGKHGGEVAAPLLRDLFDDPAYAEIAAIARRHDDGAGTRRPAEGGP